MAKFKTDTLFFFMLATSMKLSVIPITPKQKNKVIILIFIITKQYLKILSPTTV